MVTLVQRISVDVAIGGAGIVGLAHAVEALRRGLSVAVVERDHRPAGASVRNFGHACVTAQQGDALDFALEARERWLQLADAAGFWGAPTGAVVVARADDELAVLDEFAAGRPEQAERLNREETLARVPIGADGVRGGLWLPLDCRVDPRTAVPAIAGWLAGQGVEFLWGTTVLEASSGLLRTSRGEIEAGAIVVAHGHDLDRLFPDVAEPAGVRRCSLHMLRVAAPTAARFAPAVLTGLSLLRYPGFAACPSVPALRERIRREAPVLLDADVNLMLTQLPDGDLVIGDTHLYEDTPLPFQDERVDELLLEQMRLLLGVDRLDVRERWRGTYAHAPGREFLVASPAAGVRVVAVTTGIGMTTALGLAPRVLDDLFPAHSVPLPPGDPCAPTA